MRFFFSQNLFFNEKSLEKKSGKFYDESAEPWIAIFLDWVENNRKFAGNLIIEKTNKI